MISVVMPTRNRAYTLQKVLPTYYQQFGVKELIVVDDAGDDDTASLIRCFSTQFPSIETRYFRNQTMKGSSYGKNFGVKQARFPWIMIGEDDAFLEGNYTEALLKKFKEYPDLGIGSGRMIDLKPGEDPDEAVSRFGFGDPEQQKTFNFAKFGHIPDAYYTEDLFLPVTHAMILTKKELLKKFPYDPWYARGNGYREESDFHLNLFLQGKKIVSTNATHAMHMSRRDVPSGGHRVPFSERFVCNISHTHYLYKKYYKEMQKKLPLPRWRYWALFRFIVSEILEAFRAVRMRLFG